MEKLYIVSGRDRSRSFELMSPSVHIGRSAENDIQINDSYISRIHLELRKKDGRFFIRDLESTNGTFLNGRQIRPNAWVEVREGDTIVTGMSLICLGEGSSEDVLAFLDSISLSQELLDTDRIPLTDRTIAAS